MTGGTGIHKKKTLAWRPGNGPPSPFFRPAAPPNFCFSRVKQTAWTTIHLQGDKHGIFRRYR